MKPSLLKLLILIAALLTTSRSRATPVLSLELASQTIAIGDSAFLDLNISGLGNLTSPSLGAFSVDVTFDPAILAGVSATFGTLLDLGVAGSVQFANLSSGTIHLDEISLEAAADLNTQQPGSFTLATLGFQGVGNGLVVVGLSAASLSDETGTISLDFTSSGAQIQVNGPVTGVPDTGSTTVLLLGSLFGLSRFRSAVAALRLQ